MKDRGIYIIGIVVAAVLLICICCAVLIGAWAFLVREVWVEPASTEIIDWQLESPTSTPYIVVVEDDSSVEAAVETLMVMEDTIVPENNPNELAERLGGVFNIPETLPPPDSYYQVGDTRQFWISNYDTDERWMIKATLHALTEHAYFWIEDGVRFDEGDLQLLAEEFEQQIHPTNQAFFGSEWNPGIDNDPHLYIVYARNLGGNILGYFSSADEMHPLVHEYSNAGEIFYISADNTDLGDEQTYGVLAHEYQHMIHWSLDRNESLWLNEGFSELAYFMNGYSAIGHEWSFIYDPDHQLNDWPNDPNATYPYYGAAFLFTTYLLDRLGEDVTKAIVAHPENGLPSIDLVLEDLGVKDALTGEQLTANDVVLDWTLANFLKDSWIADGRYNISIYPDAPQAGETETIWNCGSSEQVRDVHQYGADYILITCPGQHTLHFEGSMFTTLLPENPYSGDYYYWTNKGDSSDMTLTRTFDFSNYSGDLTFEFYTWYDIEKDWDYVYLEASTDGGETWEILVTPSGTPTNPNGNSFGWAWTGRSYEYGPKWIKESVDISQFSGQEVLLRFEYVTDAAVNGEGMLIDDISIPEIGYFTGFEDGDDGWVSEGFVRVSNILPQTFRLALITNGSQTTVDYITLDEDNAAEVTFDISDDVDDVVLVVMGTTRHTRQLASYHFEFLP
jgi:hypothetical protein